MVSDDIKFILVVVRDFSEHVGGGTGFRGELHQAGNGTAIRTQQVGIKEEGLMEAEAFFHAFLGFGEELLVDDIGGRFCGDAQRGGDADVGLDEHGQGAERDGCRGLADNVPHGGKHQEEALGRGVPDDFTPVFEQQHQASDGYQQHVRLSQEDLGKLDHELGGRWQLRLESAVKILERRDKGHAHDHHHDQADTEYDGGIDHSRLQFFDDFQSLFLPDGDPLANFGKAAGFFAGADQGEHGVSEDVLVAGHGVADFFALGHLPGNVGNDAFEDRGFDAVGLEFEGFDGGNIPFEASRDSAKEIDPVVLTGLLHRQIVNRGVSSGDSADFGDFVGGLARSDEGF